MRAPWRWVAIGLTASLTLAGSGAWAAPTEGRECAAEEDAAPIIERRAAFNGAIRDGDIAFIETVLTDEVVLIAGTHSDLFQGRAAQLAIWRSDFAKGDSRLVYVRTPECIEFSAIGPMALEHGHWRGQGLGPDLAAGRYTAKWRRHDDGWRIEAEIFMTDECGGAACPE